MSSGQHRPLHEQLRAVRLKPTTARLAAKKPQPVRGLVADAHDDVITDAAFSYDGTRLATGSADGYVNIFDLVDGRWIRSQKRPELGSAVSKLAWAHPYYGQLIACAGYRGHLSIFAEEPGAELQQGQMTWAARMDFSDTHAITDLRFAPQQLGLILVACYADGFVRFLKAEAPFEPVEWRVVVSANLRGSGVPTVDWCERRTWDYVMALGAREGDHGVRLYHYDQESLELDMAEKVQAEPATSIAFAPAMGRSYLLLAVAMPDGVVRVHKIHKVRIKGAPPKYRPELIFDRHLHKGMASRVSWDISGTILTSAGHDRHFPAFQLLPGGEWRDFDAGKLPSKDIAPKHDDDQEQ